ncbi:Tkl protein kinase, partial [Globisporangium splendens]
MAPEVIQDRAGLASYGEAADAYSLGITFWDILHPGQEKFPHLKNNHLHIFEAILGGDRPALNPENAERDADLYHVIELAWQSEPEQRPSAQELVMLLERIQEQECARFAREFSYDMLAQSDPGALTTVSHRGSSYASESSLSMYVAPQQQRMQTTGRHAVATMLREQVVQSRPEAIRLGNLLMDAGVLHHVKHGRPFEDDNAASQVYYFDHNCIQMYEPPTISILEEAPTPEQQEALASSTDQRSACGRRLHGVALGLSRASMPMPRTEPATAAAKGAGAQQGAPQAQGLGARDNGEPGDAAAERALAFAHDQPAVCQRQ